MHKKPNFPLNDSLCLYLWLTFSQICFQTVSQFDLYSLCELHKINTANSEQVANICVLILPLEDLQVNGKVKKFAMNA